jgi:glycosidase
MLTFKFNACYFRELIQHMEQHYPDPFMPVYVFSNHDRRRGIEQLGGDMRKAKLLHMLQLTVRGVPCMYYGEEIGMPNSKFSFATALDPIPQKFRFPPRFFFDMLGITINRDDVRTPMQWDRTMNAGFSSALKTWLPVHQSYSQVNVEKETAEEDSLLNTIRAVLAIRNREKALQEGSLQLMEGLPENVLGYTRSLHGEKISILLNFDEKEKELEAGGANLSTEFSIGSELSDQRVKLGVYGGLILKGVI